MNRYDNYFVAAILNFKTKIEIKCDYLNISLLILTI